MADSSSLGRRPLASVVDSSPHQPVIKCSCGIALKVKAELAGKKLKCPGCGATIAAPRPAAPRPEVAEQKTIAPQTGPPPESDDTRTLPPQRIPDNDPYRTADLPHDTYRAATTDSPSRSEEPTLPRIPGHEVLGVLGRGGMGVVYKARQQGLNRLVALKMILAGSHAGAHDRSRFLTEAEAVARLQHPNIVQIFQIGEHEGLPYFSLEYCDSGSLAELLGGTPLPPEDAAMVVRTLAQAMHVAHEAGIIHRDLKPANVLLQKDEKEEGGRKKDKKKSRNSSSSSRILRPSSLVFKITDFGLAKMLDEAGQTASGAVMGTPSYMAPEQAGGDSNAMGPAADIYALGAILYECLIGRPPFKAATSLETIMQVVSAEPVPPSQLIPGVPRDLETICLKCLQKEPGKRYVTAGELAEDLRHFLAGEPIQARPVGGVERSWRWCRRNPMVAGLLGTVAATLILGTVVAWGFALRADENAGRADANAKQAQINALQSEANAKQSAANAERVEREKANVLDALETARKEKKLADNATKLAQEQTKRAEDEKQRAEDEKKLADIARKRAEENETKAEWRIYASQIVSAQLQWEANDVQLAYHYLNSCRKDFRGWEHDYLFTLFNQNQKTFWHKNGVRSVAYSPDGNTIISGSTAEGGPASVKMWNASSGSEILTLPFDGLPTWGAEYVAYSPDGKKIVAGGRGMLKVWDLANGKPTLTLTAKNDAGTFSPDGTKIVRTHTNPNSLGLWDTATGQKILTFPNNLTLPRVAFSPDGKKVVVGGNGNKNPLKLWDAATGQVIMTLKGDSGGVQSVAFSPDGNTIVNGGADGAVRVWDATSGQLTMTLKGHSGLVMSVAFSADGKKIVSAGDQTLRVWEVASGEQMLILKGHPRGATSVAFSPDGKKIVSCGPDMTFKVWDASSHQETLTLSPSPGFLAFSPDFKRIVSAMGNNDGSLKVWDAFGGEDILALKAHQGPGDNFVRCAAYSPDGKKIVNGYHTTLTIWDAQNGQEIRTLKGHDWNNSFGVCSVAFSPDGSKIVSGSGDRKAKVWDAASGQEILALKGHKIHVPCVAFSPDGKKIVTGGYGSGNELQVWDAITGQEILTIKGHARGANCVVFSLDGKKIVSGGGDKTLRVWDASSGQEIRTLDGHTDTVGCVAFSPDGKQIVSGSGDKTVKVWDLTDGQETLTLKGHSSEVSTVAVSPDGKKIFTRSRDGILKVWDASLAMDPRPRESALAPGYGKKANRKEE